jgi:hypothetical protein
MDNAMHDEEEDDQQRIQRLLNDAKKRELAEKYGMIFSEGDAALPPEVGAEWLSYIEEFEEKFQSTQQTTVREYVGNPRVKPLAEIPPGELKAELDKLLDSLESHNVAVHFLCEVEDAEAYRFITEELLDKEVDDMRIEGMTQNFIYEEFHPNDRYDVEHCAENFLHCLLDRNQDFLLTMFAKDELYDSHGTAITFDEMKQGVELFLKTISWIENPEIRVVGWTVEGDYATAEAETSWEGFSPESMKLVAASGRSTVRMKRSPYGGWDVIQANVAGWE